MFSEKIGQLTQLLEKQEIEAPNGIVSVQLYSELFAAYLYRDDLCNARFLWKRIPLSVKTGHAELEQMYKVYQCLWNNDIAGFYKVINHDWSKHVSELMFELKEKIQHETINLIGRAYSSILENVFSEMTNQTPDMIDEMCKNLKWEIVEGPRPRLILPKHPVAEKPLVVSAEDQLQELTNFVSFLEN
ncbi:COP9 signalosome complex subunit 8 [Toxorhynchites rutilus septentrionalis]|uniref:COP9 signalosome complex subunit 8 n=1 Tax=Toxorhynchites rutilus septentrionalis TaxID=329112 RepID=UPI002478C302|nr:COP9 signalosome complex subunit 8 [Toxorhynchites rutilus septentrionalis]